MNVKEFSDGFDTLVSSYMRFKNFDKKEELDSIEFDEYEKSLYLTMSQKEIVIGLYTGKNTFGESFELTEEMRRYLDSLVNTKIYAAADAVADANVLSSKSKVFSLSAISDLAFIVLEQVILSGNDEECLDGSRINVQPMTHDEYNKVARNPFRGPSRYNAIRIDKGGNKVEIISKYDIDSYLVRYLAKPTPIILEDLPTGLEIEGKSEKTECALNDMLHDTILKHAVKLALSSKGIYQPIKY